MVPDLTIRPARTEDIRAMAEIVAVVAPEGFLGAEPPVDVAARMARMRELMADAGAGGSWVLEDGGAVVGYGALQPRSRGVLSVAMAILPAGRGRGGGRALLEVMIDHARAAGAHKLDLEVWVDNARAIALYAATGFEVEGLRREHYLRTDGRLRSSLIMGRRLSTGARGS
jgi:putative acetyltransferase